MYSNVIELDEMGDLDLSGLSSVDTDLMTELEVLDRLGISEAQMILLIREKYLEPSTKQGTHEATRVSILGIPTLGCQENPPRDVFFLREEVERFATQCGELFRGSAYKQDGSTEATPWVGRATLPSLEDLPISSDILIRRWKISGTDLKKILIEGGLLAEDLLLGEEIQFDPVSGLFKPSDDLNRWVFRYGAVRKVEASYHELRQAVENPSEKFEYELRELIHGIRETAQYITKEEVAEHPEVQSLFRRYTGKQLTSDYICRHLPTGIWKKGPRTKEARKIHRLSYKQPNN